MEFYFLLCVLGHHECREQWMALLGEQLTCQCEIGNVTYRYAVTVKKTAVKLLGMC